MATEEIPAPDIFLWWQREGKNNFRQWKTKCQRWYQVKEISSEKKESAIDRWNDETMGHCPLDVIWKSLKERFDVLESVLEHLHRFQQFKHKGRSKNLQAGEQIIHNIAKQS